VGSGVEQRRKAAFWPAKILLREGFADRRTMKRGNGAAIFPLRKNSILDR
jgi:hypothetical protein